MLYIVCGFMCLLTMIDSKHRKSVGIAFLIILWIIGALNTQRPDYMNYYNLFMHQSFSLENTKEPGYLLLNTICYNIRLDYNVFFAIQVAISLVLLYKTIVFFTENTASILMLYLVFPFAINVVQIRFFLAISFALYGIKFLYIYYEIGSKKDIILYLIFVIIGGLIHFAILFFLICLIPVIFRKIKAVWIYLLGIVFGFLLSNIDMLFQYVLPILGTKKATTWLFEAEGFSFLHIIMILVIRAGIIGIAFICRYSERNIYINKNIDANHNEIMMDEFLYKIIVFLVISIIPLELFIQQYDRYTRFYLVLFYIFVERRLSLIRIGNRRIIRIMLLTIMFLLCYYEYSRGSVSSATVWNTVVRQLFEHNILLGN